MKHIKRIRTALENLESAKDAKDKISELTLIKILVEDDLERLKKRRDTQRAAYEKQTQVINRALKQFLTALDGIYAKYEELGDTAVREKMFEAIFKGFIKPVKAYKLPTQFGMFNDQANARVRAAIQRFLEHPEVLAASKALKSPDDRLNAFQDDAVETLEGTNSFEYFGYRNKAVV